MADRETTGTVTRIVDDKGFGFIVAAGVDYFFHRSQCENFDGLRKGDRVSFVAVRGDKGLRADRVRQAV